VAFAPRLERLPEILKLVAVAVKLTPLMLLPVTVTLCEVGLKVNPALLGVIVYVPFTRFENEYFPEASVVVVPELAPLSATDTPLVAGVIVPEIENVWAPVKFTPVALVPERVIDVELGVNTYPAWLGVTT